MRSASRRRRSALDRQCPERCQDASVVVQDGGGARSGGCRRRPPAPTRPRRQEREPATGQHDDVRSGALRPAARAPARPSAACSRSRAARRAAMRRCRPSRVDLADQGRSARSREAVEPARRVARAGSTRRRMLSATSSSSSRARGSSPAVGDDGVADLRRRRPGERPGADGGADLDALDATARGGPPASRSTVRSAVCPSMAATGPPLTEVRADLQGGLSQGRGRPVARHPVRAGRRGDRRRCPRDAR